MTADRLEDAAAIAARLRLLPERAAGRTERRLFSELNAGRSFSPIMRHPPPTPRLASVLIPIVRRGDQYAVIFTVRPASMPTHAGEISLPGGGPKPGDTSAIATALREAEEEIGLAPAHVDVLGTFGTHFGGLGFAVTPVLGLIEDAPALSACSREVDEIFEVPLDHLLSRQSHMIETRTFSGEAYRMFAVPYPQGARHIWGLTAGIIDTLSCAWHDLSVHG